MCGELTCDPSPGETEARLQMQRFLGLQKSQQNRAGEAQHRMCQHFCVGYGEDSGS